MATKLAMSFLALLIVFSSSYTSYPLKLDIYVYQADGATPISGCEVNIYPLDSLLESKRINKSKLITNGIGNTWIELDPDLRNKFERLYAKSECSNYKNVISGHSKEPINSRLKNYRFLNFLFAKKYQRVNIICPDSSPPVYLKG